MLMEVSDTISCSVCDYPILKAFYLMKGLKILGIFMYEGDCI